MRACPHCRREVSPAARRCPECGRGLEPAQRRERGRSTTRGLWLLVAGACAVLALFFGGIVAAVAIPNFLDALQKAKQTRTLADLQAWGEALEAYREAHGGRVPDAGTAEELGALLDAGRAGGASSPLSTTDAWGNPLRYACWSEALEIRGCDTYRLVSAGRDGAFEHEDPAGYDAAPLEPLNYDGDLVLGDGYFYSFPGPAR